jgi:hypothetical protein
MALIEKEKDRCVKIRRTLAHFLASLPPPTHSLDTLKPQAHFM